MSGPQGREIDGGAPQTLEVGATQLELGGKTLFKAAILGAALVCVYYGLTARVANPLQLYEGMLILVMSMLPSLLWAKNGGAQIPMFEVLMLTGANTFALPLLSGNKSLFSYSDSIIDFAALTVLGFQMVAELTYYSLKVLPGRGPLFHREVIIKDISRYIGYGLLLTTAYTFVSSLTDWIPYDLSNVLRAVFSGIGLLAVFVQCQRWGLGTITRYEKVVFILNILVQVILQFSTLLLVGGIATLLIALLGYVSGSRRMPVLALGLTLFVIGFLHNGKSQMRNRYWDNMGVHKTPTLSEMPDFFSEWIECSLTTTPGLDEETSASTKLLDRSSLFHLLCLVQSISPDKKPFLDGATYAFLPGQFIPRFFWPDKPGAHDATNLMTVYYGLQREEDTTNTTIGFGIIVEAFVNYGFFGVILIGTILGGFYKFVHGRTKHSPLLSYPGLFTVILIAWSFQTEMPLSMWTSSMFQACVGVIGLPFLIRHVFG